MTKSNKDLETTQNNYLPEVDGTVEDVDHQPGQADELMMDSVAS